MTRLRLLGVGDVVAERFHLVAEIAEGGMGRVYEAEDLRHERAAAVKVISGQLARDEEFRTRFERESQAAEHANHPHVLPVWDHGSESGYLYLATPLCDTDLGYLIEERGRIRFETALSVCGQVAWALDWAHGRGVLHRDVKPENILLVTGVRELHAYLGDFGLARMSSSMTLTQHGLPAGLSPAYAAPEQWLGEPVTAAADQYALAGTLYCCLAGHPPFGHHTVSAMREAHLHEKPPPLDADVSPDAAAISRALAVALAKDAADRYGSCEELIAAVREATDTTEPGGPRDGRSDARSATDPEHPSGRPPAHLVPYDATVADDRTLADSGVGSAVAPPEPGDTAREPQLPPPRRPQAPQPPPSEPGLGRVDERRRRRVPAPLAVAAVTIAAVVAPIVAAVVLMAGGSGGHRASRARVGGLPTDVTAGPGGVWVANQRDGTLSRVDPASGKVQGAPVPAVRSVNLVASGDGHVWAISANGTVQGLDATTAQPPAPQVPLGVDAYDVALGAGALWVANGNAGTVVRVVINGAVLSTADRGVPVGTGTSGVAVGAGRVWAVSPDSGDVTWLDPRTGRRLGTRRLETGVEDIAVAGSAAWVANPRKGQVLRLDSAGRVVKRLRVPVTRGAGLAAGDGTLAYLDLDTGVPLLIDPTTGRSRSLPSAGKGASSLAIASHKLWITYPRDDALAAVAF